MIGLIEVSKVFNQGKPNEFCGLHGINLALARRQITVFKGPSGSGKTTLLALIGCLARPTAGRITLDGRLLSALPERFLTAVRRHTFGFISFLSLYIYENPNHHCPFCILKQGYAYVGYWLYLPLFAATACGLGAGIVAPFTRVASLRQVVPATTARLTWLALAGFSLFYLIASYLVLTSALVLIGD